MYCTVQCKLYSVDCTLYSIKHHTCDRVGWCILIESVRNKLDKLKPVNTCSYNHCGRTWLVRQSWTEHNRVRQSWRVLDRVKQS